MSSNNLNMFPLKVIVLIFICLLIDLCENQEILIQESNKQLFSCIQSIIIHWFEKGSEVTYVDISYNNNELLKSVHKMKYVSVISRTTKKKILYQNEGYLITAKNLRVFKDEFMFLSMEEGWKPDVYFLVIFKELELSEIYDVFKILLRYHVFKVLVINTASNADVYTYNPFENYGCGKFFTKTISYGKCTKANITKSFFLKPESGLRNCTFEVGFYNLPPYVINPHNDQRKEKLIGIEQYVLQTLSELEQFKVIYTYKFNPGEYSGIGDDMIASGPLSFIQKGDIEIMIGGYHLMHKRSEAFGYLYGHHSENDGLIIVVKRAGLVSNLKNTYKEFDAVVWILLGVAFILFFVVFVKIFNIKDKCGTILVMWDVFFQHGATFGNKLKFRYFIFIWTVFAYLVNMHYQTNLSSLTTDPNYEYQISNENDLVIFNMKPCLSSNISRFLRVVSELEFKEENSVECETLLQSIRTISQVNDMYTIILYYSYNHYKQTFIDEYGNPLLYAFKQPMNKVIIAILFYKGFPMLRQLRLKLLHIIESGLFDKHLRDLLNEDAKIHYFPQTHFQARLIIPWHILAFGLSLAAGCFATEIIIYYIRQKIRNKVFAFLN